jgi:hypothetical protein
MFVRLCVLAFVLLNHAQHPSPFSLHTTNNICHHTSTYKKTLTSEAIWRLFSIQNDQDNVTATYSKPYLSLVWWFGMPNNNGDDDDHAHHELLRYGGEATPLLNMAKPHNLPNKYYATQLEGRTTQLWWWDQ